MNDKEFWQIISSSREALEKGLRDGNLARQAKMLSKILKEMNKEELKEFSRIFSEKLDECYSWELWGAAFIINRGICTDSMFSFFRNWLVSLGEDAFYLAIENPDSLSEEVKSDTYEDVNFDEFDLVVGQVYEKKYKEYLGEDDLDSGSGFDIEALMAKEPKGEKWTVENVHALYPKLSALYS